MKENLKKESNYVVYKHTSPSNKVYIGITGQNPPEKRWRNGGAYKNNKHFANAIKVYGWNNFEHEILFVKLTKEEADQKEIELIAYYDSTNQDKGYNIANGGNSIGKHSEETKIKISKAHKGKKISEEQRKIMSKQRKGMKLTEEWLRNRTIAQTGLKRNEKTKQRISENVSRAVICINNRIVYKSLTEASKVTNTEISHISSCCHKNRKGAGADSAGNYLYWMFYDEYIKGEYYNKTNDEIIPQRAKDKKPKSVICLNNKIVYENMTLASKETGLSKSGISLCCNKKHKYCGQDDNGAPLYWMFYYEYLERGDSNEQITGCRQAI